MNSHLTERLADMRKELHRLRRDLNLFTPAKKIDTLRQRLDDESLALQRIIRQHLKNERARLELLRSRLYSASPQRILERGYALVTREGDGKRMSSIQDAAPGTSILVQLQDGTLAARVKERTSTEV
jgi:exodeoxyribonuclease VII large subunit